MAKNAPGQHHRNGLSLTDAVKFSLDTEAVEKMLIEARWPNGIQCPTCESTNVVARPTRKPAPVPLPCLLPRLLYQDRDGHGGL